MLTKGCDYSHDYGITYTWPSSWAMVYAALIPLSSTMEQLLPGSHIVPSSANPETQKNKGL